MNRIMPRFAASLALLFIPFLSACTTDAGQESGGTILYYGDGCPHCAVVEEFIETNHITLEQKEVYNNRANARELGERAQACGLPTDNIGVPFLWHDGECLVGDQDIIQFLQKPPSL